LTSRGNRGQIVRDPTTHDVLLARDHGCEVKHRERPVRDFGGDGGRRLQGEVLPHEVVMEVVEVHRGDVVRERLAESVGQPREPPRAHAHGEILALHIARRDFVGVRLPADDALRHGGDHRRAVAGLGAAIRGERLDELREIDAPGECKGNRERVGREPVRSDLDPTCDPVGKVRSKRVGVGDVTIADPVGNDEFALGVDRDPNPSVAVAFSAGSLCLRLAPNERPKLAALNAPRHEFADEEVVIALAERARVPAKPKVWHL